MLLMKAEHGLPWWFCKIILGPCSNHCIGLSWTNITLAVETVDNWKILEVLIDFKHSIPWSIVPLELFVFLLIRAKSKIDLKLLMYMLYNESTPSQIWRTSWFSQKKKLLDSWFGDENLSPTGSRWNEHGNSAAGDR